MQALLCEGEGEEVKCVLAVIIAVLVGCGPSHETLQLVRDMAAVADADYREWPVLTEAQREEHVRDHARGMAVLNYTLNGVEVPPAYVTSGSR